MDGASPKRNRVVQAGLLALGAATMVGGAGGAATQPGDATDGGGLLALSLLALAAVSLIGAIVVLLRPERATRPGATRGQSGRDGDA